MITNYHPLRFSPMQLALPSSQLNANFNGDCWSDALQIDTPNTVNTPDEDVKFLNEELIMPKDRLQKLLHESKYVIIRHANSNFNYTMSQLPENGVRVDGKVHRKELDAISDMNLMDAELSELGIEQAMEQAALA